MSILAHYRAALRRLLAQRNEADTHRECVVVANKALRDAQVRRIKRQPGLTDEQREMAMRVLGRAGGGK